jgi:type I restriction enzyme M protein
MSEDQKRILETQLWGIANLLRGKISADDYRDYILGFIFYKYLSEKQYLYANELLEGEEVTDYKEVTDTETLDAIKEESLLKLGYFLQPKELFSELAKKGNADTESESNYIIEDLQAVMNHIEQSTMGTESEEDFNALFEDLDLTSTKIGRTVGARNEVIVKILNHLDKIDFKLQDIDADVLGDAYEYLIAKFAAGAGKSAGEFYTPQQVSKILAKIVTTGKTKLKSVYDPTCGSGSLLLRVAREVEDVGEFYGQELNRTTYNLARMNMILHDIHFREFSIEQEDTLENPQHLEKRFEAVVANPPFSAHWKSDKNPLNNTDERFSQYGRLAPKTKADYAFITHMIYQLADNGIMATVVPHGVLFRGAAEGAIREYLIKELNYLDAVFGLPANIFYGTSIPTCILVFKKCREVDDNIVFIDASGEDHYIKNGNQNELRDEDVENIINTYRNRETKAKYSYVASIDEIAENDYNLNIPRYVDTFEEEIKINLDEVKEKLDTVQKLLIETESEIAKYCLELNIPSPSGKNLSLLKNYHQGVKQLLLSGEVRFNDQNNQPYPNWKESKLGDVCLKNSSNISANALESSFGDYKIYGATGFLQNVDFYREEEPYISIVKDGAGVGRTLLCEGKSSVLGTLDILKPKGANDINFLFAILNNIRFEKYITGSTIPHIYFKDYSKEKILVPTPEEQNKIGHFLAMINRLISIIQD